jgi:hypothetical protein
VSSSRVPAHLSRTRQQVVNGVETDVASGDLTGVDVSIDVHRRLVSGSPVSRFVIVSDPDVAAFEALSRSDRAMRVRIYAAYCLSSAVISSNV